MKEVRVRSWLELQEQLFADSWNGELRRHRSSSVFRGSMLADVPVVSSLSRLGPHYERLEGPMLRAFRRYARGSAIEESIWCWLALAQHHGLPTRLVDWTFSPYVALHFLTQESALFDRDGAVWAVDYVRAQQLLPVKLRALLEEEGAAVFNVDTLKGVASSLPELDAMRESFILFFEPPALDDRIVNQHALFSVMPRATSSPAEWMKRHGELVRKIVVPAALKAEVRDKLDQANITERVLFPGLDGLARWLTRYYAPQPFETAHLDSRRFQGHAPAPAPATEEEEALRDELDSSA